MFDSKKCQKSLDLFGLPMFIKAFILGICSVNMVMAVESARIYITNNQNVQLKIEQKNVYATSSTQYFSNKFDLTESLGYDNWYAFLRDYKYFKAKGCKVEFHRYGHVNESITQNLNLDGYNLQNTFTYNTNIETGDAPRVINPIFASSLAVSKVTHNHSASTNSMKVDFMHYHHKALRLFSKEIIEEVNGWFCVVEFILQKYVRHGHMILRSVYKIFLGSYGTLETVQATLFTGDYVEFNNETLIDE